MVTSLRSRWALATVFVLVCTATGFSQEVLKLRGRTMGTTFSISIYAPKDQVDPDLALLIDRELRDVNDQMSTYLKSSEISQFNQSTSTDWIDISPEFAEVVSFALAVSEKTDGAFDVTVGPLVNAWSFGAADRTHEIPDGDLLRELKERIGHQHLSVRLAPPGIRKAIPELQIDLSSIAKGHGVDRVVGLLSENGLDNVFVEIGGEVRTRGSKGEDPWRVGIQQPEGSNQKVLIAHSMEGDQSMATSGDYNNYFEVDGKRYSHTIDPRTGHPVVHALTSVTVVCDSCMKADAWATALNVMGPSKALKFAETESLSTFLVSRGSDDRVVLAGTGSLAQYAKQPQAKQLQATPVASVPQKSKISVVPTIVLAMIGLGILILLMAVGVLFGRKPISGSCGGIAARMGEDGGSACSLCSNPADACKELREKVQQNAQQ